MKLAKLLVDRHVDALLVASCCPEENPADKIALWYQKFENTPIIGIDRILDPSQFITISSENRKASELLVRSLLQPEIDAVVLLEAMPELTLSKQRRQGALDALKGTKIPVEVLSANHFSRQAGSQMLADYLNKNGSNLDSKILICTSYVLLQGVLDHSLANKLDLHKMVLGTFGDDPMLDFLPCPVNSLPQQYEKLAQEILDQTIQAINGHYQPMLIEIDRTLKNRLTY
jgi:LacI family fructose operon transcriptional repressor